MRVSIITPNPPHSIGGNSTTARRWAAHLRALGHRVRLAQGYDGEAADVLLALHARRSAASVFAFHALHPERPVLVALTGTDLYRDLARSTAAQRALDVAARIVVLQPRAVDMLPPRHRRKTVVVLQSVASVRERSSRTIRGFTVAVLGHLRDVKDPMRTALASRLLPSASRIRVVHAGRAYSASYAQRARREMRRNSRYIWLGEVAAPRARRLLLRSRLMIISSRLEGGANVVSEAIVAGVPILASRIPGTVGLLGEAYPAYFDVGDTRALATLLWRAETDARFLARLARRVRQLAPRFTPARERAVWARLLRGLEVRGG